MIMTIPKYQISAIECDVLPLLVYRDFPFARPNVFCASLANLNLSEPLSLSLDIRLHLREPLIERRIHSPVLQVSMVPLKQ
ncbi:hypothetical protein HBI42_004190 [Parastagonospora nodorum]|nr:hypothetical protein HBI06_059220 [Parastagonospora nodorum]KAH4249917.1 hypothetical protein HBI05_011430 [Parastagonospora nodorum]KAH5280860.1 hypothetical protein HBI72_025620 [Parastagonospora nodorum]KAH5659057.1 hypothetical protein HBI51_010950 [Parastagonospora nodorum]KAH5704927.1 hypothetical protein HBI44_011090 [Parastagonospora nodorum]